MRTHVMMFNNDIFIQFTFATQQQKGLSYSIYMSVVCLYFSLFYFCRGNFRVWAHIRKDFSGRNIWPKCSIFYSRLEKWFFGSGLKKKWQNIYFAFVKCVQRINIIFIHILSLDRIATVQMRPWRLLFLIIIESSTWILNAIGLFFLSSWLVDYHCDVIFISVINAFNFIWSSIVSEIGSPFKSMVLNFCLSSQFELQNLKKNQSLKFLIVLQLLLRNNCANLSRPST